MAYDANDPEDKKTVAKLIADAIKVALDEAQVEYDVLTKGLKDKNKELLDKIKKGESNPEEVEKLENQVEALKSEIKQVKKELTQSKGALEEANKNLETESAASKTLLVDGGLTDALVKANIAPEFMPAVKALLGPQVTIKTEADGRKAVVGEKSLGDFITEWSQGDQGKAFVAAASNGGTGAPGGPRGITQPGKSMKRADYEAAFATNPGGQAKFFADGGVLTD